MQLEITNSTRIGEKGSQRGVREFLRRWLTGRRGLILAGIAVVAVGLALSWNWLTAIGLAPIILSLAPCAAMCAVGACAMMKGGAGGAEPGTTSQASPSPLFRVSNKVEK